MCDPEYDELTLALEALCAEKAYTRNTVPQVELEDLRGLAQYIFSCKDKHIGKDSEIECLSGIVDEVAAVISRTYAEQGDYSQLADDEALMLIREVLLRYNPAIINRNKKRRLPVI